MMTTLKRLHRWLGLALALPLVIQGLSGAVLTLEPALETLAATRATSEPASPDTANAAIEAATTATPGTRAARYAPPRAPGEPARVFLLPAAQARGPALVALVDPASATLLGPPARPSGVMDWTKRLHETWLIPELGGRQFAGWLGAGLVLLVLLGIPLWYPRGKWRPAFTVPRGARGAALQRRLHGALGGWLMLLLLLTGATGIVQGFPQTSRALLGLETARPTAPRPNAPRPNAPRPPRIDLDSASAQARAALPGNTLRLAFLPAGPEPIRLLMAPPGTDGQTTATTVLVDPATNRITAIQPQSAATLADRTLRWTHDLHTGEGFGPLWRTLTILTGLALPTMAITGTLLWLKKRPRRVPLFAPETEGVRAAPEP